MTRLLFVCCFLFAGFVCVSGCSERETVVVIDERSEAEQQAAYDDYDKQMAADAQNYE